MAFVPDGRLGARALIASALCAAALLAAGSACAQDAALSDSTAAAPIPPAALPAAPEIAPPAPADTTRNEQDATGGQFQVRRVLNPRYRPLTSASPGLSAAAVGTMSALDELHAQLFQRAAGHAGSLTQWDLSLGETYRSQDAVKAAASGEVRPAGSVLRALRLEGRRGPLSGALGDMPTLSFERALTLNRLRGAAVRLDTGPRSAAWSAWGGAPTPLPDRQTPRLGVGAIAAEGLRVGRASGSFALVGFGRGTVHAPAGSGPPSADSLAGRGGEAYAGARAPAPVGTLGLRLAAQAHDLDGRPAFAAREILEWNVVSPNAVLLVSEERAGGHARVLGTEGFVRAAQREDRWNLQTRPFGGRSETHVTGVVRAGGDSTLATRTFQVGGSGSFGRSPWYSGVEYVWDWRGISGAGERRLMLHAGRAAYGSAFSARLERTTSDAGRGVLLLGGEAALPAGRGVRLSLEPSVSWGGGLLRQADAVTRVTWPLSWCAARLTGTLDLGGVRETAFRGSLREASVSIEFAPRLHDRAGLEVRSLDTGGPRAFESTASYDLTAERLRNAGGWLASGDSSSIEVLVARDGNGTGVADVLVSMDGKDLRFTDADGIAHFDHVPSGVHVIAVEERSLPQNFEVVGSTRAFATVERGVPPDVVRFTIARPVRRTQFAPEGN